MNNAYPPRVSKMLLQQGCASTEIYMRDDLPTFFDLAYALPQQIKVAYDPRS